MPHDHRSHHHNHGPHDGSHDGSHDGRPHGHAHDHHAHEVTAGNERRVFAVMVLTFAFMLAEIAGGLWAGSLALLADAGHMLTDAGALALSWYAFRTANRPADARRSYGYHRIQILAAFVNGIALFAIAAWIAAEAVQRLIHPVQVEAGPMMAIAAAGLLVNLAALGLLRGGDGHNLNMRGAALHVMGDLLGSAAAVAAGGVILATGWMAADPLLSVLVAMLLLRSASAIVRQSAHILLEGAPEGVDAARIGAALGDIPGVLDVHHVHAWSLTDERPLVTLHAVIAGDADQNATLARIHAVLADKFDIDHATVQIERGEGLCGGAVKTG